MSVTVCKAIITALIVGSFSALSLDAHAEDPSRTIPGKPPVEFPATIYESIPNINDSLKEFAPTPDRWRQFYAGKWYDPYNQNVLKGDIPIFGTQANPWFFETSIISDSFIEFRRIPTPVGGPSTSAPGSNNTFGETRQYSAAQTFITSFSLINGNTSFKPPNFEFRFTPVFNLNYADVQETGAVRVDPSRGTSRFESFEGVLEAFADIHLTNLTDRYDFVSTRVGLQQFSSDFRGFIFNDNEPGVRIFGNYDNNYWQYNLAYFRRIEKDTNSGLPTYFDDRYEDVYVLNLYKQDAPVVGHTIEASILHREDHAGDHAPLYDANGILTRPTAIGDERAKNISTTYLGLTGDGHFGRINSTSALYYVFGRESHNEIARQSVDVSGEMAALEVSYDMDWIRYRASFFWASGDSHASNNKATGFDSIIDNPNFAGGDLSFWQRQSLPLIGGGFTNLVNRNSLLPDFRPGKEHGQSNFVNPGLRLYNVGVDFDLTPKFKLINNVNYLQFDQVDPLRIVRQDGSISRDIGFDLSTGFLYRPFLNNNVQLRGGVSTLLPGDGLKNLYRHETLYTVFTDLIFQY